MSTPVRLLHVRARRPLRRYARASFVLALIGACLIYMAARA